KAFCADDATIIHGTVFDDAMDDRLRVTVVATGIGRKHPAARPVLVPAQRTGTHDAMPAQPAGANGGYGDLDQPAVWRSPRGSAAAQVAALEESGVERFDIPAFLRKQAD
ncbi:MAG: cell division protein FtsZ, partial [Burkholderiaceae bacterium]|nr:cell division protein FtsZ [Burkholderiaceae bacterium]